MENKDEGHFDPFTRRDLYPSPCVNLHWWYPEWPEDGYETAFDTYKDHVGEYNGASADASYVYVTWTDNRMRSPSNYFGRNQSDIRLLKIGWPQ